MKYITLINKPNFNVPDKYGCIYYEVSRYSNITHKATRVYFKQRAYAQSKAINRFFYAEVRGYDISGICIYLKEYPICN